MIIIDHLIVIIIFILTGFSLKLTDFLGEHSTGYTTYIIAVFSAFFISILISESEYSSAIAIGIVVCVFLSGKVNKPNLIVGLILTVFFSLLLGFAFPNQIVIPISIFAFVDEIFHEKYEAHYKNLKLFLRFRPILKTAIILFFLLNWLPLMYFIGFFCFDLSYDLTSIVLLKEKY